MGQGPLGLGISWCRRHPRRKTNRHAIHKDQDLVGAWCGYQDALACALVTPSRLNAPVSSEILVMTDETVIIRPRLFLEGTLALCTT